MKKEEIKPANPVGRPSKKMNEDDRKRVQSVCISNNEKKYLEDQFGSLTKAIKSLLK